MILCVHGYDHRALTAVIAGVQRNFSTPVSRWYGKKRQKLQFHVLLTCLADCDIMQHLSDADRHFDDQWLVVLSQHKTSLVVEDSEETVNVGFLSN